MLKQLYANCIYGGFLAGLLLLLLTPVFAHGWPPALLATFLCLPAYMIHQYEEHEHDRFRIFVNQVLGGGREVLTPSAVFFINIVGVWAVLAVVLWLAAFLNPGFGLIAAYLLLVNSAAHVVGALALHGYNPGVITSVILFLPLSVWCIQSIKAADAATTLMQVLGLTVAILIHIVVVVPTVRRRLRLP